MAVLRPIISITVALHLAIYLVDAVAAPFNNSDDLPFVTSRFVAPACGYCPRPSNTQIEAKPIRTDDTHVKAAAKNGLTVGYITPADPSVALEDMKARGMMARLSKNFLDCARKIGSGAYDTKYYPPGGAIMHDPSKDCYMDRGHLLANVFGGSGLEVLNIVAMYRRVNRSHMKILENKVGSAFATLDLDDTNDIIKFVVVPWYKSGRDSPYKISVTTSILKPGKARTTYPWFSAEFFNEKDPLPSVFNYDFTSHFETGGKWT